MHARSIWWCGNWSQFHKGNCGSRMGLETIAQNDVDTTALVGWQEQEAHSPGKYVSGCPLVRQGTARSEARGRGPWTSVGSRIIGEPDKTTGCQASWENNPLNWHPQGSDTYFSGHTLWNSDAHQANKQNNVPGIEFENTQSHFFAGNHGSHTPCWLLRLGLDRERHTEMA